MQQFSDIIRQCSDFLWNNILLFVLCGSGIFFTFRLGFVQIRRFGEGMRRLCLPQGRGFLVL